jgi:hypothetical protein
MSIHLDYAGWTPRCITFANLAHRDVRPYLKRICVIKKTEEDSNKINEKNLIANRLLLKNILIDDSMSICPRHRGSFGIDWLDYKSVCHYPDPDPKHQASTSDCRRANLAMCSRIEGFPIGGRFLFCLIPIDASTVNTFSDLDCVQSTEK